MERLHSSGGCYKYAGCRDKTHNVKDGGKKGVDHPAFSWYVCHASFVQNLNVQYTSYGEEGKHEQNTGKPKAELRCRTSDCAIVVAVKNQTKENICQA